MGLLGSWCAVVVGDQCRKTGVAVWNEVGFSSEKGPSFIPAGARPQLRVLLNRLRQALQQLGCSLEADTEMIRLPRDSVASVDIVTFRQYVAAAHSLAGEAPSECIERCRAGKALYRGELLENAWDWIHPPRPRHSFDRR